MPEGEATPAVARDSVLPPFFQYDAPSDWRAIDFISDLHLSESMPRTFAAWSRHMRTTTADAVFMLGDLFEVWVGDDARQRPFERQCADVIAEAASRHVVAFMPGNRDFLLGHAMALDCGMTSLPDPTRLQAWGQSIVLSHGDALCLDDVPYQQFRRVVRDPAWQRDVQGGHGAGVAALGEGALGAAVRGVSFELERPSTFRLAFESGAWCDSIGVQYVSGAVSLSNRSISAISKPVIVTSKSRSRLVRCCSSIFRISGSHPAVSASLLSARM